MSGSSFHIKFNALFSFHMQCLIYSCNNLNLISIIILVFHAQFVYCIVSKEPQLNTQTASWCKRNSSNTWKRVVILVIQSVIFYLHWMYYVYVVYVLHKRRNFPEDWRIKTRANFYSFLSMEILSDILNDNNEAELKFVRDRCSSKQLQGKTKINVHNSRMCPH